MSRGTEGQPAEGLDCIECKLQYLSVHFSHNLPQPQHLLNPFGKVIHQYTDTLFTTQKLTNVTNSILQDINVFNEYDLTKLEEWLTDIERAVDLTNENWAIHAKQIQED